MTSKNQLIGYKESVETKADGVNVGQGERIASTIAGGALIGFALVRRSKLGIFLGLFGVSLIYRGTTGKCEAYRKLGINTADSDGAADIPRDVHIKKSVTINRPAEDLYSFWRSFENLPRFMPNLKSVSKIGDNTSHWVATTSVGKTVEWDAEIYNDIPNELIAWRSLPNADVTHAGSVNFKPAPSGRGTYVEVTFNYNPPLGKASALIAKLFGLEPGQIVEQNLQRLKQLFEAGVIPTIDGQTSGRSDANAVNADTREQNINQTSSSDFSREARGGVR
jgi:uncharacterized membrane protein